MDEIALLTAARPDPPQNADEMREAARSRLVAATGADRTRVTSMRRPRSPVRRRIGAVAAAAVAAAAALVVTQTVGFRGSSPTLTGPPADAATLLKQAAAIADADADAVQTRAGDTVWTQTLVVETTVSRIRGALAGPAYVRCRETWETVGFRDLWGIRRHGRCPDRIPTRAASPPKVTSPTSECLRRVRSYPDPSGLSADPSLLLEQINRWVAGGWGGRLAAEMHCGTVFAYPADSRLAAFVVLAAMLNDNLGYPRRATLYRALAQIPGIAVTHSVEDAAGRRGVGIGITSGDIVQQIILDNGTHRYLGQRFTDADVGTFRYAQLRTAVFPARDR